MTGTKVQGRIQTLIHEGRVYIDAHDLIALLARAGKVKEADELARVADAARSSLRFS